MIPWIAERCGSEVAEWWCPIVSNRWNIGIGVVIYMLGMSYAQRYTCGCDDHAASDFFTMLFWPIAVPYIIIKGWFE